MQPISIGGFTTTVRFANLNGGLLLDLVVLINNVSPDVPGFWVCLDPAPGVVCTPAATVTPISGVTPQMEVVDVTGDGFADILVSQPLLGQVDVYVNDGFGDFSAPPVSVTGLSGPSKFVVGNFDGAGFPDLAVLEATLNQVSILAGDGAGGFTANRTRVSENSIGSRILLRVERSTSRLS